MESVSEAKYTYWHTIIVLAKASGVPKEEWCRKNCISIKTFNHYEGVFRRQEARNYSYRRKDAASSISGFEETVTSSGNRGTTEENVGTEKPDVQMGTNKARYFEVPMPGSEELSFIESGEKEEKAKSTDVVMPEQAANEQDVNYESSGAYKNNVSEKDTVTIEAGGFRLTLTGGVNEETLRNIFRAVRFNA